MNDAPDPGVRWGWLAVGSVAAAAMLISPWRLLSTDAFLALSCGREIAAHGLPKVDTLTYQTLGHVWTDQQWLAQWFLYEVEHLFGLRLTLVVDALVTAWAFAMCAGYAIRRGASQAAALVCGIAGFGIGMTFFTLRPQTFSLVGFGALLVLLGDDVRAPSRRVWWVLPILALGANLHGVDILGAMLVGLRGWFDVIGGLRARDIRRAGRGVALGFLAAATPFATPYARALPRYLHEIGRLQDPVRALPILEWNRVQWPDDWPFFSIFAAMLILLFVVHKWKLSRPSLWETLVIAITGLAAWQASRHLQWFGLALAAYGPVALDATPPLQHGRVLGRVASLVRVLGPLAFVGLVARILVISDAKLENIYSLDVLAPLARAASDNPSSPIAISDVYADWALWYLPELRGRIETDVRFELLDDAQARAMGAFLYAKPGWQSVYREAHVVLVSRHQHKELDKAIVKEPGARVVFQDKLATLVVR